MPMLDNVIEDIAGRFNLGAKAGPLVREVVQLVTGSPGGIGGFIDRFKAAGLGSQVASWLGRTDGAVPTAPQVEQALGSNVLGGIANRLGLPSGLVAAAIGYLTPKVIGQMTPGGVIPSGVAPWVSSFLGQTQAMPRPVEQVAPVAMHVLREEPHLGRWLIPLLAGLGVLGLLWYLLSGINPPSVERTATAPAAVPAPAAVATVPAHLAINNDEGVITYSGTVHDEATRTAVVDSLKAVFGASKVKGDIAIDANAGPARWVVNLRSALEHLKTPGVQAVFDGDSLKVGGMVADSDRDGILNSLRPLFGTSLALGALSDRVGDLVANATSRTEGALSSLRPGFSATDVVNVLNQSIINFPSNSADIPAISKTLLDRAAGAIKQLPQGTVIEIAGYTDTNGDPASNLQLSQQRAEAVKAALVQAGVDPGMLVAKGYGNANPVAANDTLEGRLRNRRIEYRVAKSA
ncbi:MAG: OmpA family protein [Alphaproteobacteria bacterium]|nr:OmpA family protein [Alphaproteobacteria bacterium]